MSNDVVTFPAGRLCVRKILGRMRLFWVAVFARVGVGVFVLIQVAKRVVDLSMLALVCTDYSKLAETPKGVWLHALYSSKSRIVRWPSGMCQ